MCFIPGLSGFFPLHPMTYITAKRNRAKAAEAEKEAESELSENTDEKQET